jgi:coenzyme F420 hydrogenase subunit beta
MKTFKDIDQRLCTYCGTCIGICPENAIVPGERKPVLAGSCKACGICFDNCPGKGFPIDKMNRQLFGTEKVDREIGYYQTIKVGYSTDRAVRKNGASGGAVTAILLTLLEKKMVDGAIAVGMDEMEPWKARAKILYDRKAVLNAAQSKYTLLPLNAALKEVGNSRRTFALVGLPCHIHGLRLLQFNGWAPIERIKYFVGLFCGFNMEAAATDFLIKKTGFKKEEIGSLAYRSGNWPGGLLIKGKDGREAFVPKRLYNYLNLLHVPARCLLCPDLTNEFADISVGDAWERSPDQGGGWSRMIVRNDRGQAMLSESLISGNLSVEDSSKAALLKSSGHLVRYKKVGFFIRNKLSRHRPAFDLKGPEMTFKDKMGGALFYGAIQLLRNRLAKYLIGWLPIGSAGKIFGLAAGGKRK